MMLVLVLGYMMPRVANAQKEDPAVAAAEFLLKQATTPQRNGSHNSMLLGLRQLEDPALLPLFQGLNNSPHLSMRIHGRLGQASLSPQRQINLAPLAEIKDQRELALVLSAAMDDDLISHKAMRTLLTWKGLDLPLRQAVALRLIGLGEKIDTTPFVTSLDIKIDANISASRLLQYTIAAVIMSEHGDARGQTSLNVLAQTESQAHPAVLAQVFDASMRYGFTSVGGLAMEIGSDAERAPALRLLATQCAMRLGTQGAAKLWQSMFESEERMTQRIRLAMIGLDSAAQHKPEVFNALNNHGEWIWHIAQAGRAIASQNANLAKAFEPLVATGQPLSVQWVVTYCQRDKPKQGADLLASVIRHHHTGPKHHRGKMTQTAIDATAALCETYPKAANVTLLKLLEVDATPNKKNNDSDKHLQRRQIILFGIAQANNSDMQALAKAIQPDDFNDFTTEALRLLIRAKHGQSLADKEWQHVADIVQGVGQFPPAMRLQLAWAYLKHKKRDQGAIPKALLR